MDAQWVIPSPKMIRQRAAEIRRSGSRKERESRNGLPPDSVLRVGKPWMWMVDRSSSCPFDTRRDGFANG
jgi:hypothetical protein